jgi:F0F1-type ATP synthase epsilon subunit
VKDDVLSVVTTEATAVEELDRQQADAELAAANAESGTTVSPEARERALQRARAKVALTR